MYNMNLNEPRAARAYKLAAGYFLSSWPQNWSAKRLAEAITADADSPEAVQEDQRRLALWDPLERYTDHAGKDVDYITDLIESLTFDILNFDETI